jgi:hypothetical protein
MHPKLIAIKKKKRAKVLSVLKFLTGSAIILTVAVFAAVGIDSHFGFHRISRITNLKGQCFMYEKTQMSVNGEPLVGHSLIIDTDNKRFKFGYGATLDSGQEVYFIDSQLSEAYGVKRIDCEIYWNNAIRYKKAQDENK